MSKPTTLNYPLEPLDQTSYDQLQDRWQHCKEYGFVHDFTLREVGQLLDWGRWEMCLDRLQPEIDEAEDRVATEAYENGKIAGYENGKADCDCPRECPKCDLVLS